MAATHPVGGVRAIVRLLGAGATPIQSPTFASSAPSIWSSLVGVVPLTRYARRADPSSMADPIATLLADDVLLGCCVAELILESEAEARANTGTASFGSARVAGVIAVIRRVEPPALG